MVGIVEKYPYHPGQFRGGAVIASRHVAITAAHCVNIIPVYFILLIFLVLTALYFSLIRMRRASRISEEIQIAGQSAIISTTRFAQQRFIRTTTLTVLTTMLEFTT